MAYTQSPMKSKSNPDNFGGTRVDANRVAMNDFGNYIQSVDATASPLSSPITVNTTATLTVPQGAVQVTIVSVTNPVQVSEDSTYSAYFSLPAAIPMTFDCANQQYVYLQTSGSTVVSFQFKMV